MDNWRRELPSLGFEALARWHHPRFGLVTAGEFIPLLEQVVGQIAKVTEAIMLAALREAASWNRDKGRPISIALNLSARLFDDVNVVEWLSSLVAAHNVEPALVVMEVTESAMASDQRRALEILARLRMQGFGLAIDD